MSVKSVRKYVKEHKSAIIKNSLIIIGTAAGFVLAVVALKKTCENWKEAYPLLDDQTEAIEMNNAYSAE